MQKPLPYWVRILLVGAVVSIATGLGLLAYKYYTRPTTLSIAVGSLDGETGKAATLLASRLASTNAPVRLAVIDTGNVKAASEAFALNKVDMAVVREDIGDLSNARTVALLTSVVVLVVAPPGTAFEKFADLGGHSVGVVGGQINSSIVSVLSKQYDLTALDITFKDVAVADAHQAIQSGSVSALLMVLPLARRYISYLDNIFQDQSHAPPNILAIEPAGAIADIERAYKTFTIPKGTLQGAPPVPPNDRITLRTGLYLVARSDANADLIANLTREVVKASRDLSIEDPSMSSLSAPELNSTAYIPVHPGAAEFYTGTQKEWLDKYANWIFLLPIVFGAAASIFAAIRQFLQTGEDAARQSLFDSIYQLPHRIRDATSEAELTEIEDEIDRLLKIQLTQARSGAEAATNALLLHSAAHRLDNLIYYRRSALQHDNSG
ncbi:MAG: ABC transporter substrate-binding protein [Xanthobacteraceae bacterium]|nr:ABC transporter substrate-binding protein [Xanthobacteraceae bacterium]